MLTADPFQTLFDLQRGLEEFHESPWLGNGDSSGPFPSLNVFRKGEDFVLITELPGIAKTQFRIQVRGNSLRIAGRKTVEFPEGASVHRRERAMDDFDRSITLPVQIDAEKVKAEYRDGILAIFLPRAEHDKPKTINVA